MKKILIVVILAGMASLSFANEPNAIDSKQIEKLSQQISYARNIGDALKETYYSNPNYYANYAGWKVDTTQKNQCISLNLNNSGYAQMIYPRVKEFANSQSSAQLKSYVDLMNSGLSEGYHNLILLMLKTSKDVAEGKMTQAERKNFIQQSPLITINQRKAIIEANSNPKYQDFFNFFSYDSLTPINSNDAYQVGLRIGAEQSIQFIKYISKTCQLN